MTHLIIFSIIFKSTLLYLVSQNTLKSWWQQPLWKIWVVQCLNGAMTHISRKMKSCRQHAPFLWLVKLMLEQPVPLIWFEQVRRHSSSCNLSQRIIYHFSSFVKSYWAATFLQTSLLNYKSLIKLRTNRFWLEIMHDMDMVLPCKNKEVVP